METTYGVVRADAPGAATPVGFQQDPISYLSSVAATPPSYQAMEKLAGSVAKWFHDKSPDRESSFAPVAAAYLKAASIHLEIVAPPGEAVRLEAARTKAQYEIVGAVGCCATLCQDRRGAISSSGILPVLGRIFLTVNGEGPRENRLSVVGVEFLQCALLAEQYRYAARLVEGTWPRPDSTVNVKQVYRYYYLRGMIHLGCDDYLMAHRCFWTCLSVPAEVVCKTAIEAWKKLVLVQCVMNDGLSKDGNGISVPKSMPTCIGRLLTASADASAEASFIGIFSAGSRTKRSETSHGSEMMLQRKKSSVNAENTSCYLDISTAFYSRDKTKLESLIAAHEMTLKCDGNFGLVQQCLTQLVHNQVREASKMFSVIPLVKLAAILGIPSGEAVQQQVAALLIQSAVPCEIHEDGMIEFGEVVDKKSGTDSLVDLANWIGLLETVQRLDVDFLTSHRYQSLIKMDASIAGTGGDAKGMSLFADGPRGVDDL